MNPITIIDKSNNKTVIIPWRADLNVQEALETASDIEKKAGRKFDFAIQYFGYYGTEYLGYLLVMLDNIYDNPNDNADYWLYYINGSPAQVGIDDYMVNAGDKIEFDYMPISKADTSNKIHTVKHSFYTQ